MVRSIAMHKKNKVYNLNIVKNYKHTCFVPFLSGVKNMTEAKALEKLDVYVDAILRIYRCPITDKIRTQGITKDLTDRLIKRDGKAVYNKDIDLYSDNRFKNMCNWYQLPTLNELAGCPAHYLRVCKQVGLNTLIKIDKCLIKHGFKGLIWHDNYK